jgi:hypothetical protein
LDFLCPELLPNAGGHAKTGEFLQEIVDILIDYIRKNNDRSSKVRAYLAPMIK